MDFTCKNCSVGLQPDYDYCPKCSQKAKLHRLSLHELLHEAIHYFTHADKGIFQLVRDLLLKRGAVAREYAEGKRKKYFSPLNFFLLVCALYVFAMSLGDHSVENVDMLKKYPELAQIQDTAYREKAIEMYQRRDTAVQFLNKYANIVSMVSLPITALFFWLFYRKGRFNYTEHMVAGMYMYGFTTLLFVFQLLLNFVLKMSINYLFGIFFIFQIGYFSNFYYTFFDERTKRKAFKAFAATLISTLLLFIFCGIGMWLYMVKVIG
jgi:hypothetical protein